MSDAIRIPRIDEQASRASLRQRLTTRSSLAVDSSLGAKLRRLARHAEDFNPWNKPPMRAVPGWKRSTAYVVGDMAVCAGNIYVCTTAGTSGTGSGPSAITAAQQTDGTAAWTYFGLHRTTQDPQTVQTTWAGSTAYSAGDIVLNGSSLYSATAAGTSASSGGPTGTAASVDDGTVAWTYFGAPQVNPYLADFPTYTFQTPQPSGLGNIYNPQNALGLSARRMRGCYNRSPQVNIGTLLIAPATFTPVTGANAVTQHHATEFYSDAPKLWITLNGGNNNISIVIDGIRYSLQGTDRVASGGGYVILDFSTRGGRKIRRYVIEGMASNYIGAIGVDTGSQVWPPSDHDRIRCVCISDSYFAGSTGAGPYVNGNSTNRRIGWALGWTDCWDLSQGGTGYVSRGVSPGVGTEKFGFRVTEALTRNPDVWLIAGSTNDGSYTAEQVQSEALAMYQAIRAGSNAPIIVVGVWSKNDASQTLKNIQIEAAIQAAIAQFDDPLGQTLFVPIAGDTPEPWITGGWNNSAHNTSGNSPTYITSDGAHPSDQGTGYYASRITTAIKNNVLPLIL